MKEYESHSVEFKRTWKDEYLKTICAFANSDGGMMIIGVDNNGNPVGIKNVEKLLEELPNKIRNKLTITPSIYLEKINGHRIIKIEISPSAIPVSYNGRFYVRSGSTTQEIRGIELLRFIMKKQGISWDTMVSDADISEIDMETVDKFTGMAGENISISKNDSVEKILENLELIRDGKLTNAAVLLFTRNPQKYIPNSVVKIGRFKTPTQIIDSIEIGGNLFKQVDEMVKYIKKNINVLYKIEDLRRTDVWEYPIPAIREACVNALIHRDYLDSTDIQIKIYDDHIWFWNPGKLPEGLNVEMLKREHPSKLRNRLLAMVFYYAGWIEKWGTGTVRIISLCKNHGLPEPEFKEEFDGFSVILWKDIYNEQYLKEMGLMERQIKAVMYVKENGSITNSEYQRIAGVKKRQATEDLRSLEDLGILERVGRTGKGVYYTLKGKQWGNRGIKGELKGQNIDGDAHGSKKIH